MFFGVFFITTLEYIGNEQVIHFSGEDKKEKYTRIILSSINLFLQGHSVIIHAIPKNQKHAKAIVQIAGRLPRCSNKKYMP